MPGFRFILIIHGLSIAALMSFVAIIGSVIRLLGLAEWHGGLVVTVAGVLWVFSARSWGRLSDKYGRKFILMWALLGFAVAFLALAVYLDLAQAGVMKTDAVQAVVWSPLLLLILLVIIRGAMGLFYAAILVANMAWLADNFPAEKRRAAMSKLGASSGTGLVFGPLLAGFLAAYNLSLPMYLAAGLVLLALLILWWKLSVSEQRNTTDKASLSWNDRRIRFPLLAMFLATSTIIAAQICVGFFAMDRLMLDAYAAARASGQAMTGVGITLIIVQLLVVRLQHIPPKKLLITGSLLAAVGLLPLSVATSTLWLVISYSISAAGLGMILPCLQALTANSVNASEQGLAAGTLSSAQGMATVVSPLLFTMLYQWHWLAPYALASVMMFSLSLYAYNFRQQRTES